MTNSEHNTETPAQSDYRVFCAGIDAYRRGEPRQAPPHLYQDDPDHPALWLAGYDSERDERRLLRRAGYTD